MMQLGAQLFTLRDYTQTAKDFAYSMGQVAKMGYKTVQISAIGPIPAQQVREICDENGLQIVLTHTDPQPYPQRYRGRHPRARHHGLRLHRHRHDAPEVRQPPVACGTLPMTTKRPPRKSPRPASC